MQSSRMMSIVRSNLMFDQPFWAHIGFGLELIEDPTCDAGWTDGVHLAYNPAYVAQGTLEEAAGLFVEECGHNVFGHLWRMQGLDKDDANRAADLALFAIIQKIPGCSIPKELFDPVKDAWCEGKSMEYIYSQIRQKRQEEGDGKPGKGQKGGQNEPQDDKQGGNEPGKGNQSSKPKDAPGGLPRGRSELREPPPEKVPELKAKWEQLIVEAYQAAIEAGSVPAGIEQIVEKVTHPKVNYKIKMRQWMTTFSKNDLSYRRPNPKFIPMGQYRPSRRSEAMGKVVLLWDTSGSRDSADARAEAAAEFGAIHSEVKPETTYIMYVDAKVHRVDEFGPDDEVLFNPVGGGGTDLPKGWDWLKDKGIEPACTVVITDMNTPFGDDPGFPVLWITPTDKLTAPYGETLRI